MRILIIVFYLVLITLGVVLSVLNSKMVELNLYYVFKCSTSVLILLSLIVGIIVGLFSSLWRYLRLKMAFAKLKSQLALSEREVKNLRSIPIQDQH